MPHQRKHAQNLLSSLTLTVASLALTSGAFAQEAPIVQPGALGEAPRALNAEEAAKVADASYTRDDVRFMQHMIPHHFQAVQMSALVKDRTNRPEIIDLAGRIDAAQADEISFMQDWLRQRGEQAPDPTKDMHDHDGHGDHGGHDHHMSDDKMDHEMMGMATPEQMEQLAASKGVAFDRLFLQLMIPHHEGAIRMVNDLLRQTGSAYDPVLFEFVNDIVNDQSAEIAIMTGLLGVLAEDPRTTLAGGFRDAEVAILNMEVIANLPKPAGFFDPANPSALPPQIEGDGEPQYGSRWPMLNFWNTDMAFQDDKIFVGSYHGFNIYQLEEEGAPTLLTSVVCPGGQGDVSVVGDLLIMSVEQTRGRIDCGQQGVSEDISDERFRGIRIFDIIDLSKPVQVGQVQTCRGSHTHSVISGPDRRGNIIVYNGGIQTVRSGAEMEGCVGAIPGDKDTALFRIDVIEIPVDNPAAARIVDSPAVFADPKTGALAGLWRGGDHGEDTQTTHPTDQCHDITAFPSSNIAAGACAGNGIIFDISNPRKPKRMDAVVDDGFAYWHSATFNNDGTKVLFTDEWGGGVRPRCQAHDPQNWGANAIYDIVDGKLEYRSHYKLPAPQSELENCVAHNGSFVPVPGRDIMVQSWYQGGISVLDFTDSANPFEIGYFDRGPINDDMLLPGGFWSSYWYKGKIYGTEMVRGLDVLALTTSEHLSENELAAALMADQGDPFNPQQQNPVTWPAEPVVARAYLDQLERKGSFDTRRLASLRATVDRAENGLKAGTSNRNLSRELERLARDLTSEAAGSDHVRQFTGLGETLNGIAARLR